jgi:cytoskeleton protein RodZ
VDNHDESLLPDGKVYGADNRNSRLTLLIHRKTKLAVMGRRDKLLLQRRLEPGDSYRAPNLPDLTVTTADAGAVEVMFNGTSLGFVGEDGEAAIRVPLKR